jgi:hypothetical protein
MSTRYARVVRGLVVACVSLLVAAVAHVSGGGQIGRVGFVLALTFSVLVSIGLTGRAVSRLRIAVSVVLSQAAFHLLFGVGAGYQPPAIATTSGMRMPGMTELATPILAPAVTSDTAAGSMNDSGWMWVAHGLAAVVTIVALIWGETTFWHLTGRVRFALRLFSSPGAIVVPRRLPSGVVREISEPSTRFLIAGMRHRGPPAGLASD